MSDPIQMTRAEYTAKYGQSPSLPAISAPKPSLPPAQSAGPTIPLKMTRTEYQAKYGAAPGVTPPPKPLLPPAQTAAQEKPALPFNGELNKNSILGKTNQVVPDIAKKTIDIWKDTLQKIPKDIKEGATDIQKGGILNTIKGVAKGMGRTAADAAGAIFAPISATVGEVMDKTGMQSGLEHVSKWLVDKSGIADQKWFQNYAIQHPNAEEDFNRGLTLIMAKGEKGEINPQQMIDDIKSGKFIDDIKNTVPLDASQKLADVNNAINQKVGDFYSKQQGKDLVKTQTSLPGKKASVTGKILQTSPEETVSGERALQSVDLKGVKDYKDLSSRFKTKVDENTVSVDKSLDKDTQPHKAEELSNTNPTKTDFTQKAIDQLKDYYTKTENPSQLKKIENIETKYKSKGLTAKEINNLARQHGKDLNAYNQNGQLASGLTKQAAENVRTGVKEAARSLMPDEDTRSIDKETTDLLKAKELAEEMHEKVEKLKNTIEKPGKLKWLAGKAGKILNTITFRTGEGFIKSFFPDYLNLGEDSKLNPIQLQEQLGKNIEALNALNKMTTPEIKNAYEAYLEKYNKKPLALPAPEPGSPHSFVGSGKTIINIPDEKGVQMPKSQINSEPLQPILPPEEQAIPRQNFVKQFGTKKRFFSSRSGKPSLPVKK